MKLGRDPTRVSSQLLPQALAIGEPSRYRACGTSAGKQPFIIVGEGREVLL